MCDKVSLYSTKYWFQIIGTPKSNTWWGVPSRESLNLYLWFLTWLKTLLEDLGPLLYRKLFKHLYNLEWHLQFSPCKSGDWDGPWQTDLVLLQAFLYWLSVVILYSGFKGFPVCSTRFFHRRRWWSWVNRFDFVLIWPQLTWSQLLLECFWVAVGVFTATLSNQLSLWWVLHLKLILKLGLVKLLAYFHTYWVVVASTLLEGPLIWSWVQNVNILFIFVFSLTLTASFSLSFRPLIQSKQPQSWQEVGVHVH